MEGGVGGWGQRGTHLLALFTLARDGMGDHNRELGGVGEGRASARGVSF